MIPDMMRGRALRALVKHTLKNPDRHRWTLQGFGMLRTYLDDGWRLHVWDHAYAVPEVTVMHDHPWHFDSLIVAGMLSNQRFRMEPMPDKAGATHMMRTIKPGIGLRTLAEDQPVRIRPARQAETYLAGEVYHQQANEIHVSSPQAGTITLVRRERVGEDVARSFYPITGEWVSGEPRDATYAEIRTICGRSLERWFSSDAHP